MKIAFLTPEFPSPKTGQSGGIGTSILNLSRGLVEAGQQVSVIVYGQKKDEIVQEAGLTLYLVRNVKFKGLSWLLTRIKIRRLINDLHSQKIIDIVEAPDWTGITSFIRPKCPVVVRLHGSDTYFCHLDRRKVKWANRYHEKRALKKANALLSVSDYTAKITRELFNLNRVFQVIPNCIDAAAFKARTPVVPNTILYFGTLIRKKGLLELPHIFNYVVANNPKAKLILIGRDSPDAASGSDSTWELMAPLFSREALQNVDYKGSVPYSDIAGYIASAAVCVFPTFAEALPVSWIEAMAMEKAVVASNIGWAPEVIEDQVSGFLSDPKDHDEFAKKICILLSDSNLMENIGQSARQRVMERFDIGIVAEQSLKFYAQTIKNATQRT